MIYKNNYNGNFYWQITVSTSPQNTHLYRTCVITCTYNYEVYSLLSTYLSLISPSEYRAVELVSMYLNLIQLESISLHQLYLNKLPCDWLCAIYRGIPSVEDSIMSTTINVSVATAIEDITPIIRNSDYSIGLSLPVSF